jgi:hypothetical protein
MQTDNILMLKDDHFAELKENELKKAKLTFKKREMLITLISIKFNERIIFIDSSINVLLFNQLKQFDQIRLINISTSTDLINSKDQIRKSVTLKNQYVTQRTRKTYIDRSSLFRFDISRRLIHASYKQFYIHEKSESLRIKIKSNRSKFADDSSARSFKCVTTLSRTKKEKEKKNDDERRNESIKIRTEVRRSTKIATTDRVASII